MDAFLKMDVFFVVTTVAVVVTAALLAVVLIRVLRILKKLEAIADMVSVEGEQIREDIQSVRTQVREGGLRIGQLFGFLTGMKKKPARRSRNNRPLYSYILRKELIPHTMATKKTTKSKKSGNMAVAMEIGAGVLAAAAAAGAASYYFYGTKNAKKHQHAASVWAKGLKRDVVKGVKKLKKVDAQTVAAVIEEAAATYRGMRGVADTDVQTASAGAQAELEPDKTRARAIGDR